jgi:peptidoglycan/LPS O-acetylase OafA/YrhL
MGFANLQVVGDINLRSDTSGRPLNGLEILRFGAALAVVMWHYQFFFPVTHGDLPVIPGDTGLPFHSVLTLFYSAGHYAVPWFWTLSGYIFFWNYEASIAEGTVSATEFSLLRFSRLYPLHLLTLLLVTILQIALLSRYGTVFNYSEYFNPGMFVAQLFMASNWFTIGYSFNGPIWSISIEVLVYAVFFVLARAAALRTTASAAGAVLVFFLGYWTAERIVPGTSLVWLLQCAVSFFSGGVLVKCREMIQLNRVVGVVFALILASLYVVRPTYAVTFTWPAAGVLLFSTGAVWQHPILRHAAKLGNLTYGSYLLHFPVALAIVLMLKYLNVPVKLVALSPWFFLAYFVVVFGVSHFSFNYFERPAQALIRRKMLGDTSRTELSRVRGAKGPAQA